ncbi:MAG: MAPEG family protein [Woeseiaceae bacterium]|nr:MAPEG family protein [Woeseiaceae bacterium]
MELIAIVTGLAVLQSFLFAFQVGQARVKHGIDAPAMSGAPGFDRAFRVHANTVEQLVIFIPGLWMFGYYVHELIGAIIGVVFIIGRFMYRSSYLNDPGKRAPGFGMGALSMAVLVIGGMIGAGLKLI